MQYRGREYTAEQDPDHESSSCERHPTHSGSISKARPEAVNVVWSGWSSVCSLARLEKVKFPLPSLQLHHFIKLHHFINITTSSTSPPPASIMASQPRQRLPNELIDHVYKHVDPADKATCAAICRTNKAGTRAMCGLNERDEVVGKSIMYHTIAFKESEGRNSMKGHAMAFLIRTLLERLVLVDQMATLELKEDDDSSGYILRTPDWPDLSVWREKLLRMDLPQSVFSRVHECTALQFSISYHYMVLAVLCTKLKVLDITNITSSGTPVAILDFCCTLLANNRRDRSGRRRLGQCGLHSIEHIILRNERINENFCPNICDLGLAFPALQKLTIFDVHALEDVQDSIGPDDEFESTLKHIEMLGCHPDVLCPANSDTDGILTICPSLKKLHVVWTTDTELGRGRFWDTLANQLGTACEEICFDITALPGRHNWSEYIENEKCVGNGLCSSANLFDADEHQDTTQKSGDNLQGCRLGSIKHLQNLRKLRVPKTACVGCGSDDLGGNGQFVFVPEGVLENFNDFLANSLPNDTSQLEFEIVCRSLLISNEDQSLLTYAACKKFKSVTIYNRSKTAWVSSLDQPLEGQELTEGTV